MTLVWDENHEEDFDWSWKDQSEKENLLAEYIEALDDAGANHALAELKITPIFVWLGRYGICTGPLCWTLLGKEVKYDDCYLLSGFMTYLDEMDEESANAVLKELVTMHGLQAQTASLMVSQWEMDAAIFGVAGI
jgi:hypothetical protein